MKIESKANYPSWQDDTLDKVFGIFDDTLEEEEAQTG